ncbi:hypothetical protein AB0B94_30660 [Micromonospora sp. NPDC048986]|uniref:phage tail fiber protein n=1 Tax=Micromonospora sp. NPDC048986 TaxID=3155644 RepID=UPI0033EFD752
MPLNDAGRAACLLGGLTNAIQYVSVHDAIPGDTGTDEVTGGSYARVVVDWHPPAGGAATNDGALTHNMPAGSTAVAYGLWSALSGGTYYGWSPIKPDQYGYGSVDAAGVTADAIQSAAHGLSNGDRVALFGVLGASLPTGLIENTLYYVVQAATDTFKVSLTLGGSPVGITGQGELFWMRCIPETFASAGQLVTADEALVLDATGI